MARDIGIGRKMHESLGLDRTSEGARDPEVPNVDVGTTLRTQTGLRRNGYHMGLPTTKAGNFSGGIP